jgi:hypothetical protein
LYSQSKKDSQDQDDELAYAAEEQPPKNKQTIPRSSSFGDKDFVEENKMLSQENKHDNPPHFKASSDHKYAN